MAAKNDGIRWPAYWPPTTKIRGLHPLFTQAMSDQIMDEMLAILPTVDESKAASIRSMRIPALVAFMVPHSTSRDRLVILCKWLTCLLLFENLFEYPCFSQREMLHLGRGLKSLPDDMRLLATAGYPALGDKSYPEYLRYVREVLTEMFRLSPRKDHFLRAADYLERAIAAMRSTKEGGSSKARSDDLEDWKRDRIDGTGMYILFHWMEFALDLHIPGSAWDDPAMQFLMDEACLQSGVVNDLYSLPKELMLNDGRIDMDSINCVAWLMRGTGETLQEAVDRCWDYIHHLDDSVVQAAIVAKSRFRSDQAIFRLVDAIVYSLQGWWAFEITSSQSWLDSMYDCSHVTLSEKAMRVASDGKQTSSIIAGEKEVNDVVKSGWTQALI
ncbi:terpenoid synthase [Aspergillus homomorphus CBS 101889]|uniref:Terpenoid synthase n=1 Tax=Aspergillus homomorphus (strain CBS 101889) TaxID=1450537 RepID=A0A395HJD1_ASPHC|nr:terpenoid synthase [Aspergillus homomorphus CBS 101889]RAL07927.1 terpenoid synthase [Aspergillus homomorphus CBS 101889]